MRRGRFSPDFCIKLNLALILVVEIKDDNEINEPEEENPAKSKYAREHFDRINVHLKQTGEALRYQFNFLTPRDFNTFFQMLREGRIMGHQSNLDIRLLQS